MYSSAASLSTVSLRAAQAADLPHLRRLFIESFPDQGLGTRDIRDYLTQSLASPRAQWMEVADIGTPVGFCAARMRSDVGVIQILAVDKHHQRKKHATTLLERVCRRLIEAGAMDITLNVSDSNIGAINLYKQYGFATIQQLPNGYGWRRGALEMSLNFGN